MNDFGYYKSIIENLEKVNATQSENIRKAAELMTDAIALGSQLGKHSIDADVILAAVDNQNLI